MSVVMYIVLGGIVGWVASVLMGRKEGIITDILVGIVGAVIGDGVMQALGGPAVTGFNLSSFLVALLGAIIFLFILGLFRHGSSKHAA